MCTSNDCLIYPKEITSTDQKLHLQYAALTQQGADHIVNQDRGILMVPNKDLFLMGIFDGHGNEGHTVAQYLQHNVSKKLTNFSSFAQKTERIKEVLKKSFIELDRELDDFAGRNGGSTAAIVIRQGSVLYFASVGDSLCFLSNKKGEILFQTKYDKPHMPEEKNRILQMGGNVNIPPNHPIQARSVAFNVDRNEMQMLAMSRSIGDWEHIGVIAEPHVDVVEIPVAQEGGLVVCGSDGIFESRKPSFIAQELAIHGINRAAHLIQLATPKTARVYRDDITLIVYQI